MSSGTRFVEFQAAVEPGKLLKYDMRALCSALGVTDPACLSVETDGLTRALVTVYETPPLANVPAARGEDLVIDRHGYLTIGRYHDGQPAKIRLYEPGSAQRSALFGTTGAGKSRANQLLVAAEKRSGVVTWLADLKGGQSMPEAAGNVDWHVTTQEETIYMLRAGVAVAEERMARYAAMGRSAFILNRPDPLLSVRIDEANRLLEKGAEYRDEAAKLVKELGRTGRSVGVGVHLAAQAGHVEELGGSDTLRGMLKEGETILLRWSSSMMQSLVSDGLLPPGTQLAPIAKRGGPPALRSRFAPAADDDSPRASTAGSAYLLGSDRPTALMRFFRVGGDVSEGLDPLILDLYGTDDPTRLETASHDVAGPAYAGRGGPLPLPHPTPPTIAKITPLRAATPPADPAPPVVPGGGALVPPPSVVASIEPPAPAGLKTSAPTTAERILTALANGPLSVAEVHQAVNADGGRTVAMGGIRNALTGLKSKDLVVSLERGMYDLPS